MILLITPYQNANDCGAQIQRATREQVKTVDSIRTGLAALRSQEFSSVVADENLLECSPGGADALMQRMQSATPIFLDMACMKPERIAKSVEVAMRRREMQSKSARESVAAELHSELRNELTALLLSSELAMKAANVSASVTEKLALVLASAKRIRARLEQ